MKAIDKVTRREHAICPVLGGYQVCLIPDMDWKDATINYIACFSYESFAERFDLV